MNVSDFIKEEKIVKKKILSWFPRHFHIAFPVQTILLNPKIFSSQWCNKRTAVCLPVIFLLTNCIRKKKEIQYDKIRYDKKKMRFDMIKYTLLSPWGNFSWASATAANCQMRCSSTNIICISWKCLNTTFNFIFTLLNVLVQWGGVVQYGGLHLWHSGRGPATRLDSSYSQNVHQQKSGSGDQQLVWRRGGEGERFLTDGFLDLNADFDSLFWPPVLVKRFTCNYWLVIWSLTS